MSEPVVAKVWWDAPHSGLLERFIAASDVITFGRGGDCSIRVGHAPVYQPQVPRTWGELTWHREALVVRNTSVRWGLSLVPALDTGSTARITVPPGAAGSCPVNRFQILAQAPDVEITIQVLTSPRGNPGGTPAVALGLESAHGHSSQDSPSADPPSFVPFTLTPTQRTVGSAIIAPLLAGRPRRASYTEVAAVTHYAERTVREAVAAIDGLFVLHRLTDLAAGGDALDRVAATLRLHTTLLGAGTSGSR